MRIITNLAATKAFSKYFQTYITKHISNKAKVIQQETKSLQINTNEKGVNTFPFHNLSPELKKTSRRYFLFFSPFPSLDKRKVGGDSCYLQQLRSNVKHPSQFSHRVIELATLLGNYLKVGLPQSQIIFNCFL